MHILNCNVCTVVGLGLGWISVGLKKRKKKKFYYGSIIDKWKNNTGGK